MLEPGQYVHDERRLLQILWIDGSEVVMDDCSVPINGKPLLVTARIRNFHGPSPLYHLVSAAAPASLAA